jgi:hypothetical protein
LIQNLPDPLRATGRPANRASEPLKSLLKQYSARKEFMQRRFSLIVLALLSLSGCGGRAQTASRPSPYEPAAAASKPAPAAPSAPSVPEWLEIDSAGRSVSLRLEVTAPPGARSALINGYRAGEARVIVPLGWTVQWDWRSADSAAAHSLVVMMEREKFPLEGGRPAFSNATTRRVTDGLRPGENDRTSFLADEAGWYWLLCGVPGHAIEGEWISLKVDREARLPSVVVKGRAVSGER